MMKQERWNRRDFVRASLGTVAAAALGAGGGYGIPLGIKSLLTAKRRRSEPPPSEHPAADADAQRVHRAARAARADQASG